MFEAFNASINYTAHCPKSLAVETEKDTGGGLYTG